MNLVGNMEQESSSLVERKKKQTKYEYTNKNTVRKHKGMDYVQVPD